MAARKPRDIGDGIFSIRFWTTVIKELGIPAFIVLFFTMMFLFFATKDQKEAFIDRFFLFKDVKNNPFPFAFVVAGLVLVVLLQYIYYNKIIGIKEDENKRLGEEKTDLQQRLLNKRLNTSRDKN